jgi:hypothetical protein
VKARKSFSMVFLSRGCCRFSCHGNQGHGDIHKKTFFRIKERSFKRVNKLNCIYLDNFATFSFQQLYYIELNLFCTNFTSSISTGDQRYTYRVLQTIQMKLILLCVWAEPAILGSTKTALKFKYEKLIG